VALVRFHDKSLSFDRPAVGRWRLQANIRGQRATLLYKEVPSCLVPVIKIKINTFLLNNKNFTAQPKHGIKLVEAKFIEAPPNKPLSVHRSYHPTGPQRLGHLPAVVKLADVRLLPSAGENKNPPAAIAELAPHPRFDLAADHFLKA
jgi:hypothetical protein